MVRRTENRFGVGSSEPGIKLLRPLLPQYDGARVLTTDDHESDGIRIDHIAGTALS